MSIAKSSELLNEAREDDSIARFLAAFKRIEAYLSVRLDSYRDAGYRDLVNRLATNYPHTAMYRRELLAYADLRNVLSHPKNRHVQVVTGVSSEFVEEIERVAGLIENPPKIADLIRDRNIVTLRARDTVADAVAIFYRAGFSKIPLVGKDGALVDVLTTQTVARWLGDCVQKNIVADPHATRLSHLLSYKEENETFGILGAQQTVQEAVTYFQNLPYDRRALRGLLITDTGAKDGTLVGILTGYDLPELVGLVNV